MNFYNDISAECCAWQRELIAAGLVPDGVVDQRSIADVQGTELAGYTQCHWFAGILGWPIALQLAGWPADRAVWTGSAPCQPFSAAGKRKGTADERHLWPEFMRLIRECRPAAVFGEQVEGAVRLGWLDGVFADLEAEGYACGAVVLGAHSVSSPHIRQRLFWVADAERAERRTSQEDTAGGQQAAEQSGDAGRLGDTASGGCRELRDAARAGDRGHAECSGGAGCGRLGGPTSTRPPRRPGQPGDDGQERSAVVGAGGNWTGRWHLCRDGKARRVPAYGVEAQSVFQCVLNGLPRAVGAVWDQCLRRTKERLLNYAQETSTRPREVLRTMWNQAASAAIQRKTGGHVEIRGPELLLIAMCQLARDQEPEFDCSAQDFACICEATVRAVWGDGASARSSHQWQLAGPSHGELGNAMHPLSLEQSTQETIQAMRSLLRPIQKAGHVPEALSAMEEVWRPVLDKEATARNGGWIRAYSGIIEAASGFPLSESIPGRVGLLRGAGNAIVPQVAAAFIAAYMEATCEPH